MCEHYTEAPKCPQCLKEGKEVYTFIKTESGTFPMVLTDKMFRCCPECDFNIEITGKDLEDVRNRINNLAKDDMLRTEPYRPTLDEIFTEDVIEYMKESVLNGWNDEFAVGFQFKIEWDSQETFYNEDSQFEGTYQYFKVTYSDFENVVIDFMAKVSNYPIELVEILEWDEEFYQECLEYMEGDYF